VEAIFFASLDDIISYEYEVKPYNTYPLDIDLTYDATLGEKVDSEPIIDLDLTYGLMGGSDVIESLDDTIDYEYELHPNTLIELSIALTYNASLGGYAESNLTMDLTFDSSVGSKSEAELSLDLAYEYELSGG
jgi:hypothetical protein